METICKELYEDEVDLKRHLSVMQELAKALNAPLGDIIEPYEKSLKEIRENAKVKDFITVLVIRDVKETIKEKSPNLK